jgi:predicted nucleic acid-binding protein
MPIDSQSSEKAFVDTNIFAYAEDLRDPTKRSAAISIITALSDEGRMVISTQVMNEFCAVLRRGKVGSVSSEEDLKAMVEELEAIAEVAIVTTDTTRHAIHAVYNHSISWNDALIWAAAKQAGCTTLYTEDIPGALVIEGLRYINPFV